MSRNWQKKKNRNSALNKKCRMLKCFHFEQIKLDQIPIYAYLHPTIWKTRDTPTHLLTPSSCQGLPLRNTPNKIQLNNYFWLWEKVVPTGKQQCVVCRNLKWQFSDRWVMGTIWCLQMFLPVAANEAESLKGWQEEQGTSVSPTQKLAHYI